MMKKTALITGASSGIVRELAHIHAERGGDPSVTKSFIQTILNR